MSLAATKFNRGSGKISTQQYVDKRPQEERDTDSALQFYVLGGFISIWALVIISFVNIENDKDKNGKDIIDPNTNNPKKKYTTTGIVLTVLFSLLLAAVFAVFVYRNFIMKATAVA